MPRYRIALCAERQVAVQTIKGIARRRWPDDYDGRRYSWYQPLEEADAIGRAVRWVLGNPQVFLNSSSDARLLRTALEAAIAGGSRPTGAEMEADVAAHGVRPLFDGADLERI
jgi:hypothetical protein